MCYRLADLINEMAQTLDSMSFMDCYEDGILTCYECQWCKGSSVGRVGDWTVDEARESVVHTHDCKLRALLTKIGVPS